MTRRRPPGTRTRLSDRARRAAAAPVEIVAPPLRRFRPGDRLGVGPDVAALPRPHERRDVDVELFLPRQPLLVGRDGEARGERGEIELLLVRAVEIDRPQRALVLALE